MSARDLTRASRQQGVVLFVALIVLVIMALTGVAMIRQSGSAMAIAGNVGMRQFAVSVADLGTEAALAWWLPQSQIANALNNDIPASGYFSDWGGGASDPTGKRLTGDPSQYDWTQSFQVTGNDGYSEQVFYIIERLCMMANTSATAAGQQCVTTPLTKNGNDKSGGCVDYPLGCQPPPMVVHYRVSARVLGVRNSVSYTQMMLTSTN